MGGMGGMGGSYGSSDPTKDALVARIKAFQKGSEQQKELWGSHCDTNLRGVRDPARHDVASLESFIATYGIPDIDTDSYEYEVQVESNSYMPGGDPLKDTLVNRIKAYQRSGEAQREAWYGYCGSKRDPARHEAAELQEFVNSYGVP